MAEALQRNALGAFGNKTMRSVCYSLAAHT